MNITENLAMLGSAETVDSSVSIDSVALARLVEEVRSGDSVDATSYNRTYNRHNR
jgi:hypothetical protein